MAAFYSLLCKAIKKQPAGRSGRLFWRSGRDSNPRAIARKLISKDKQNPIPPHRAVLGQLKCVVLLKSRTFFSDAEEYSCSIKTSEGTIWAP